MNNYLENSKSCPYSLMPSTVASFIMERCEAGGNQVFLKDVSSGLEVTYKQLWDLIRRAAFWFKNKGLKPGDHVLLALENDLKSLTLFFASLCQSIIPTIFDKNISIQELKYLADLMNPKKIINFSRNSDDEICLFVNISDIERLKPATFVLDSSGSPDDIAYTTFTSGTTGVPKGVRLSNRNVLSEISGFIQAYCLGKEDIHLCVLPISHASALYRNVFLPFSLGSKVVMSYRFNVNEFWKIVEDERVAFVQIVPSMLSSLLASDNMPGSSIKEHLRFIGSASAPHPEELVRKFEERFGVFILQGYGMTEATCGITLANAEKELRVSGSVGRPIPINVIEIWDENNRCLPGSETGKVMVRGENIMIGYVGQKSDSNIEVKDGWLNTGDMGYLDEDNNLFLIGRKGDFIKRAGHRISPKEIENALYLLKEIKDAAVLGIPCGFLGEDIVAFVTFQDKYSTSGRKIISKLKGLISSHKLPSEIYVLNNIPRNSVGKIDHRFLHKWLLERRKNRKR